MKIDLVFESFPSPFELYERFKNSYDSYRESNPLVKGKNLQKIYKEINKKIYSSCCSTFDSFKGTYLTYTEFIRKMKEVERTMPHEVEPKKIEKREKEKYGKRCGIEEVSLPFIEKIYI